MLYHLGCRVKGDKHHYEASVLMDKRDHTIQLYLPDLEESGAFLKVFNSVNGLERFLELLGFPPLPLDVAPPAPAIK
jgi:hypothetical protein